MSEYENDKLITITSKQNHKDDKYTIYLLDERWIELFETITEHEKKMMGPNTNSEKQRRPGIARLLFRVLLFVLHRIGLDDEKEEAKLDSIFQESMKMRCATEYPAKTDCSVVDIYKSYKQLVYYLKMQGKVGLTYWKNNSNFDENFFNDLFTRTRKTGYTSKDKINKKTKEQKQRLSLFGNFNVRHTSDGSYYFGIKMTKIKDPKDANNPNKQNKEEKKIVFQFQTLSIHVKDGTAVHTMKPKHRSELCLSSDEFDMTNVDKRTYSHENRRRKKNERKNNNNNNRLDLNLNSKLLTQRIDNYLQKDYGNDSKMRELVDFARQLRNVLKSAEEKGFDSKTS